MQCNDKFANVKDFSISCTGRTDSTLFFYQISNSDQEKKMFRSKPEQTKKKKMIQNTALPVFVYGSLMAPEVLQVLIGRTPSIIEPVYLKNYNRWKVKGYVFPGMIPSSYDNSKFNNNESLVKGKLLMNLSPSEQSVLDWFEGDEYKLTIMDVWSPKQTLSNEDQLSVNLNDETIWKCQSAKGYVWANPLNELNRNSYDGVWSYDHFRTEHLSSYLSQTVIPCRQELDRLGIGISDKS